jgi:hypothetical protein
MFYSAIINHVERPRRVKQIKQVIQESVRAKATVIKDLKRGVRTHARQEGIVYIVETPTDNYYHRGLKEMG